MHVSSKYSNLFSLEMLACAYMFRVDYLQVHRTIIGNAYMS